jgi:hypothetical protein
LLATPALARKDCEELKSEIDAKMQAKGVKNYTLEIKPNEETKDLKEGATIVGSCDGGTKKIVYTARQMSWASVRAVVAGVLFIIVAHDPRRCILHLAGVFPPSTQPLDDRQALIATSYRIVLGIVGAWITARLAPGNR